MKPVFINGLGCFESGARAVFRDLMRAYPANGPRALVVMPSGNRADLAALPPQVRVLALNHRVFGRWLRPFFEAGVAALAGLGCFSRVVNLSHYGWCPGGNYTLYFHNQLLVENGHDEWSGRGGRPNGFKRWCLRTCLRRAETIVVQTPRVAAAVKAFAQRNGFADPRIEVVTPRPEPVETTAAQEKVFPFQLFYPASGFAHKRVALAMRGATEAHRRDGRVGLVLTLPPAEGGAPAGVCCSGPLTREQVAATYTSSDALLFTSSHETLGLPLLEALAAGLPAVLPALDYSRDIYGDAAVYFEADTPDAVAAAILECVGRRAELAAKVAGRRAIVLATTKSWAEHWAVFGVSRADGATP